MTTKNFISVDYSEISPPACCPRKGEFLKHTPIEKEWGIFFVQQFTAPNINLVYFEGEIRKDLHIREHSDSESTTVNSCFSLAGNVMSTFKGLSVPLTLEKGLHNYIYKPEVEDDHYIKASRDPFKLLHLELDRDFYINLLDDQEKWSAELKENLLEKNIVYGSDEQMEITPKMNSVLLDILYCPLTGPLRRLMIEAKVLELIACQLHYFNADSAKSLKVCYKERDTFYAIRAYLADHFFQEHSLQSLSRMFCINEFKLKKGFKDTFGTTVFDYIHNLRMQYAKSLIQDQKLNINIVAGKVGYKNANHFSTAFKRQFGLAPSQIK
jgi:AraC-like DNA-binding protein